MKYTKPILSFPELGARVLVSHQQLSVSTRKSQTGLGNRQELDKNARVGIWIWIAGRTMSRVLFRSQPWTKSTTPS